MRRSTPEKVLTATANVTSGTSPVEIVASGVDNILAPKGLCIAGGGTAASVTIEHDDGLGSTTFLTLSVPVNDTVCVDFPVGLECPKGKNIQISTDQTVDATLYYCVYDESAGVTKVQSRANTFSNVTQTRTPSNVIGHDKS